MFKDPPSAPMFPIESASSGICCLGQGLSIQVRIRVRREFRSWIAWPDILQKCMINFIMAPSPTRLPRSMSWTYYRIRVKSTRALLSTWRIQRSSPRTSSQCQSERGQARLFSRMFRSSSSLKDHPWRISATSLQVFNLAKITWLKNRVVNLGLTRKQGPEL